MTLDDQIDNEKALLEDWRELKKGLLQQLMSVAIYFGYTNAYSTDVNTLTVKILGIPIYELTKSGTEYIGKSIEVYMGAVCGICMAISVIAEELISKARHK